MKGKKGVIPLIFLVLLIIIVLFLLSGSGLLSIIEQNNVQVIVNIEDNIIEENQDITLERTFILKKGQDPHIIVSSISVNGEFYKADFIQMQSGSTTPKQVIKKDTIHFKDPGLHKIETHFLVFKDMGWISRLEIITLCDVGVRLNNLPYAYSSAIATLDCQDLSVWLNSKPMDQEYLGKIVLYGPNPIYPQPEDITIDPLIDSPDKISKSNKVYVYETDKPPEPVLPIEEPSSSSFFDKIISWIRSFLDLI